MNDICPLLSIALGELTECREQECHWYNLECCIIPHKRGVIGIAEFQNLTNVMVEGRK